MQVRSRIRFLRDIGRHAECVVEKYISVSGEVTETADEYEVVLDKRLDLWTPDEIEQAEQALIAAYKVASLPYVLGVAA